MVNCDYKSAFIRGFCFLLTKAYCEALLKLGGGIENEMSEMWI